MVIDQPSLAVSLLYDYGQFTAQRIDQGDSNALKLDLTSRGRAERVLQMRVDKLHVGNTGYCSINGMAATVVSDAESGAVNLDDDHRSVAGLNLSK